MSRRLLILLVAVFITPSSSFLRSIKVKDVLPVVILAVAAKKYSNVPLPLTPLDQPTFKSLIYASRPLYASKDSGWNDNVNSYDDENAKRPQKQSQQQPSKSRAAQLWSALDRRSAVRLASTFALLAAGGSQAKEAQAAIDEFPWVAKGGLLDGVLPESVLVESLPLNNQAVKGMGEALNGINELRGLNVLHSKGFCNDGQVKADLSFVAVNNLTSIGSNSSNSSRNETTAATEIAEVEVPDVSIYRWTKIKGIADNVRSIFDKEKDAFPYALTIRVNSSAESQNRRRERFAEELRLLDRAIAQLQNATRRENTTDTLRYQEESLLHLGHLGELMVAKFPFSPPRADERREDDYYNLPRLFGRAEVDVVLKGVKKGGNDEGNNTLKVANLTIIVDGFNAPISAGNFIDLCQRGFYNRLPLKFDAVTNGKGQQIDLVVGGRYKSGFVDPIKGKERRVPLEIMRAEAEGNRPSYGQARNTGLFTRAPPLLSFRTPRAVGLLHPEQDGNGANSEFFWLQQDGRCVESAKYLDGKYSLFGYVIGGYEVLPLLNENYMIDSTVIRWGLDHFVRSRVSFIDILLQGDDTA